MPITRSLRSPVIALALALGFSFTAGACGGDDDSADPDSSSTTTSPSTTGPEIKLIKAGAEPLRELRLDLKEGTTTRAALTVTFGFELEADGKPLPTNAIPPIRIDLLSTVKQVKGNGEARVDFAYERIEVVDDGTVDKAVIDQVRKSGIDKLANVRGSTTVTSRGVAKDSSVDVPDDLPANLKQVVDQVSQQTGNLTIPFPEEAVGPGASWTATTGTDVGGIKAKLVLTYGLRQLDGNDFVLDVSYEQSAGRQKTDFPGLPSGTEVELQDLSVKGAGEVTSTLASVLPTRSSLSATGVVNLDVAGKTQNGQPQKGKLVQRLSLKVLLETKPPG